MQSRIKRFLLAYALLVSTLCGGALVTQAIGAQSKTAFDEIDVKRSSGAPRVVHHQRCLGRVNLVQGEQQAGSSGS
jgi:hypothetical protein